MRPRAGFGRPSRTLPAALALVLAGCGSASGPRASPFASLFETSDSSAPTPDVLDGVWAQTVPGPPVSEYSTDLAVEFRGSLLTAASRCKFPDGSILYAGVQVAIRVDTKTITSLEAKTDHEVSGSDNCQADVGLGQLTYAITGLAMIVTDTSGTQQALIKIHD